MPLIARWRLARLSGLLLAGVGCQQPAVRPQELRDAAIVEETLSLASRTFLLNLDFGDSTAEDQRLIGVRAREAHLVVESIAPPGPEVVVLPATDSEPEGLRVSIRGDRVGRGGGEIVVATGLARPARLTALYSWDVTGNLEVDPTNPFLDLGTSGALAIRVSSRRDDFRPIGVTAEGPFKARLAPEATPAATRIEVRFDPARAQSGDRSFAGTIWLRSNDPAEPRKSIPLFALGDPARARER